MVPFLLKVLLRNGNIFNGEIFWPSLDNSQTKCKGELSEIALNFTEDEILKGNNQLVLHPISYSGNVNINDNLIAGTATTKDGITTEFRSSFIFDDY